MLNVAMHACDQVLFLVLAGNSGLLLEYHALTLVAHSYVLLSDQ